MPFMVSSTEIFTQTRYLLELERKRKTSTFFGIKSEELLLSKRNRLRMHIENACYGLRGEWKWERTQTLNVPENRFIWDRAEGESTIMGFRSQVIINYSTQTEGKRVVGQDTEIGSKAESQSYNNHRKINKWITIKRQDLLDKDRKPEMGYNRQTGKQ